MRQSTVTDYMANFSVADSYERFSLELIFLLITCFSLWKIVLFYNPQSGGRVISSFYGIICITALIRAICLFIEVDNWSGPSGAIAFKTAFWYDTALAQASQVFVSMLIFSVFILLVSFWSHMSTKVADREIAESRPLIRHQIPSSSSRRGPLEKFFIVMTAFLAVEISNYALFFVGYYDSNILILYDAIVFMGISLLLLMEILVFSSKVRSILKTMAAINADSSVFQIQKIKAMTIINCTYLLARFALEAFSVYVFYCSWNVTVPATFPSEDWTFYLRIKTWADAGLLLMQLLIAASTAPAVDDDSDNEDQFYRLSSYLSAALHVSQTLKTDVLKSRINVMYN